ncbi:hypothetical protein GGX14DRAFT_427415 [Mycena pura]|uniref:Uncharacterized protein n=1 Tax=Mycena pura TaxID=153505 RepID=A0AAD6YM47_9AGAR|nr:hypothetical protein GGX14DRAFT_427415 [Mycena pura]
MFFEPAYDLRCIHSLNDTGSYFSSFVDPLPTSSDEPESVSPSAHASALFGLGLVDFPSTYGDAVDAQPEWTHSQAAHTYTASPDLKRKLELAMDGKPQPFTDTGMSTGDGPSSHKKPRRDDDSLAAPPSLESQSELEAFVAELGLSLDEILDHHAEDARAQRRAAAIQAQQAEAISDEALEPEPEPEGAFLAAFWDEEGLQGLTQDSFTSFNLGDGAEPDTPPVSLHGVLGDAAVEDSLAATPISEPPSPVRQADTDSDVTMDSDSESESSIIAARSRCPCPQCSPSVQMHPDYQLSREQQREIHRLFALSPFA